MWDETVIVPDHCIFFHFEMGRRRKSAGSTDISRTL